MEMELVKSWKEKYWNIDYDTLVESL
jgi:aryl carrier-like protein